MENMNYLVHRVNQWENAITLLYNAGAMVSSMSKDGDAHPIYTSIKAEEQNLRNECQAERDRIYSIICAEGKMTKSKQLPLFEFTDVDEWWDYNGEMYWVTRNGNKTLRIKKVETPEVQ